MKLTVNGTDFALEKLRNSQQISVEGVSGKGLVGWSSLLTVEKQGSRVALSSNNVGIVHGFGFVKMVPLSNGRHIMPCGLCGM
jgi:hypothetical protein